MRLSLRRSLNIRQPLSLNNIAGNKKRAGTLDVASFYSLGPVFGTFVKLKCYQKYYPAEDSLEAENCLKVSS